MSAFDRSSGFDVGPFVQHHIDDEDQGVEHVAQGQEAFPAAERAQIAPALGRMITIGGRQYYTRDMRPEATELPTLEGFDASQTGGENHE